MIQVYDNIDDSIIKRMLLQVKKKLTDILLTSNGSTTKLLETITGQAMEIHVVEQKSISKSELCDECQALLENCNSYLKRIVSLNSNGSIFSDNVVMASLDILPEEIKAGLAEGKIPLGKLIGDKEIKRELLWSGHISKANLYENFPHHRFSLTDYPAKKYLIYADGSCWFYLLEVFHIDEIVKHFWDDKS